MPLDGAHFDEIDLIELQPGKEGLRQLSYLLRHPEKWPAQHHWDFRTISGSALEPDERPECGTVGCAMGLADQIWGPAARYSQIEDQIPAGHYSDLFFTGKRTHGVIMKSVIPTMVADAIDSYLATGHVPVGGVLP